MKKKDYSLLVKTISEHLSVNYFTHLEMILTTRCNLRCSYCFEKDTDRLKDMTSEIGIKALDEYIKSNLPIKQEIVFFGGEPFVNWQLLKQLIIHARKLQSDPNKLDLSIVTNGTIIPKEAESFLAKYQVLIMVSLDLGINNHDKHRRTNNDKPTFNLTLDSIKRLKKAGNNVIIRSTITPDSTNDLVSTYELCKELGVSVWYLSRVTGVHWKESDLNDLKLNLESLFNKYHRDSIIDNSKLKIAQVDYIKEGVINAPCNAGKFNVAIDPDGNIFGCSRLATTSELNGSLKLGTSFNGIDLIQRKRLVDAIQKSGCPAINFEETGCYVTNSDSEKGIRKMFKELERTTTP